ncbi:DUF4417 domain-containing protein [Butyrivibrio sp. VCB2006]|uniref:DUF4417 domain-containing protein n=1 Tax=Butyrivibrio sp. VCB2006 TaxID=1280679 RepID=UPI0004252E48|nr:DUF4417 domain-containing protein [Butyrivibrio sp. VCB2006]
MEIKKEQLNIESTNQSPRNGCFDMWNAFMVKEATFSFMSDIPTCPCTAQKPPVQLISYEDAKALCKKEMKKGNPSFMYDAFIHFYIDDQKFDGKQSSIWTYPDKALEIISHFSGIITPDFSTNADFPDPIKRYNTYRMRALGYWISQQGIPVINNVRWGTEETWSYCFDGIPKHSTVAIGTVASNLKSLSVRATFEMGLNKMVEAIAPSTIIVYGSANYPFFETLNKQGITIIAFPSKTSEAFARRKSDE